MVRRDRGPGTDDRLRKTSAEYFIEAGYAVIFLHRQFSLQPYSRHYSHATDCFLDFLDEDPGSGRVTVRGEDHGRMKQVLRRYSEAKSQRLLLLLSFVTINDYLHMLRGLSQAMQRLGRNGLLYLAAAVSDFFLPVRPCQHPLHRE